MKRLLALIVVLLISTLLFSKGELIHETQHFRIIYSKDTKSIANNIIEDKIKFNSTITIDVENNNFIIK